MVSVRITRTTISMEMMAAISKVGAPKVERGGEGDDRAVADLGEVGHAGDDGDDRCPATMASRMDRREMVALPTLLSSSTRARVTAASPMLAMLP